MDANEHESTESLTGGTHDLVGPWRLGLVMKTIICPGLLRVLCASPLRSSEIRASVLPWRSWLLGVLGLFFMSLFTQATVLSRCTLTGLFPVIDPAGAIASIRVPS